MRRVPITEAGVEGATLARDIVASSGEVLARAGRPLGRRAIRALRERGVTMCFVDDAVSDGLHANLVLGENGVAVAGALSDFYRHLRAALEPFLGQPTVRALEALRVSSPAAPLRASESIDTLRQTLSALARDAAELDGESGYLTDRQADDDLVGHSVGVAALSVRVGALVGFSMPDLLATAYAAALHDAGMIFVPPEVRHAAPARWTAPQRQRFQDHALLGEAVLAPLAGPSLVASIVAAEHHEAQSGRGFPRGVPGGNRVLRRAEEKRSQDRIALVSEIVALADRWERLVSPGPERAGLTPAAARLRVSDEAGTLWNAELVGRFLDSFPMLPLATPVRIVGGRYEGFEGVVSEVDPNGGQRPKVRLHRAPDGPLEAMAEVDLRRETNAGAVIADPALAA